VPEVLRFWVLVGLGLRGFEAGGVFCEPAVLSESAPGGHSSTMARIHSCAQIAACDGEAVVYKWVGRDRRRQPVSFPGVVGRPGVGVRVSRRRCSPMRQPDR